MPRIPGGFADALFPLAVAALAACAAADDPATAIASGALTCPVPVIDPLRSLAVTDPEVLAKFSFQRVMSTIASTGNASNTPLAMYQAWMATFATCDDAALDPNGYGLVCPRVESEMASFNPFTASGPHFEPIALTNRFDLAPADGADCGEYRIAYALKNGVGRAFIIFEARLPNPAPSAGIAGCAAVADFWAQLSNDASTSSRATKLEAFYFTGLTGFAPVVAAAHYGLATPVSSAPRRGQVRTNFFFHFQQWHLREFQLAKKCAAAAACALAFQHVTVKINPADELFDGSHAKAPAFQAAFLDQVPALQAGSAATITMDNNNDFNEYESVSQGSTDTLYATLTSAGFQAQIASRITNPKLTARNILDRATTQTCAGCHQLSAGTHAQLGDGVVWPASLGFVHIDEQRTLSPALLTSFLPQRAQVLSQFLAAQCSGASFAPTGRTLSGRPLDAAN